MPGTPRAYGPECMHASAASIPYRSSAPSCSSSNSTVAAPTARPQRLPGITSCQSRAAARPRLAISCRPARLATARRRPARSRRGSNGLSVFRILRCGTSWHWIRWRWNDGEDVNRVVRIRLEPGARVREGEPRLQALLRRDLRRTLPGRAGSPLRAGIRRPARPREAGGPAPVANPPPDLRQFDERPLPGPRAHGLHRVRGAGHGEGALAHLPGPDEATRAHAEALVRRAFLDGASPPRLVRRERREPPSWPAPHPRASRDPGGHCVPLDRAAARRPRPARPPGDRLGHRRWRERPPSPPDAGGVGALGPRPVPPRPGSVLLQAVGWRSQACNGANTSRKNARRVPA